MSISDTLSQPLADLMLARLRALTPTIPALAAQTVQGTDWQDKPAAIDALAAVTRIYAARAAATLTEDPANWRDLAYDYINRSLEQTFEDAETIDAFEDAKATLLDLAGATPDTIDFEAVEAAAIDLISAVHLAAFEPIENETLAADRRMVAQAKLAA